MNLSYQHKYLFIILIPILLVFTLLTIFGFKIWGLLFLLLFVDGFIGYCRYKAGIKLNSTSIKIIKNKFIPFKGYAHMMFFGFIFTRKEYICYHSIEHELIHKAQALETGWFLFYFIYLLEGLYWTIKLLGELILFKYNTKQKFKVALKTCYDHICFDQEAHMGDDIRDYKNKRINYCWIDFLFNNNDDSQICWNKIYKNNIFNIA